MLVFKTIHIISVITWFAGLFYLPRLFVYHAMSNDSISLERFKIMERKLYNGIMTPSAVITIFTGFYLLTYFGFEALWIKIKITLVVILSIYHFMCYKYLKLFKENKNSKTHIYYRWFNEFPVIIFRSNTEEAFTKFAELSFLKGKFGKFILNKEYLYILYLIAFYFTLKFLWKVGGSPRPEESYLEAASTFDLS